MESLTAEGERECSSRLSVNNDRAGTTSPEPEIHKYD